MRKPIIRVLKTNPGNGGLGYYRIINNINSENTNIEIVDPNLRKKFRQAIKEQVASFIERHQIDFKIQYSDRYESIANAAGEKNTTQGMEILSDLISPMSADDINQLHYALRNPSLD